MKAMKLFSLSLLILSMLLIYGCWGSEDTTTTDTTTSDTTTESTTETEPSTFIPEMEGPTELPSVEGPTEAPPDY